MLKNQLRKLELLLSENTIMAKIIKHETCVRSTFSRCSAVDSSVEPFGPTLYVGPGVYVGIKLTHVGSQFYTFSCQLVNNQDKEFIGNYKYELSVRQGSSEPINVITKSREGLKFQKNGVFRTGLSNLYLNYFSEESNTLQMILRFNLEEIQTPEVTSEEPPSDSAPSKWFNKISCCYEDENFKDLTLKIGENFLTAHRLVLVTRSKVFYAMLQHDTKERREGVIEIKDSDVDSFEAFLKYCYTDEFEDVKKKALDLLILADKYNVLCLKKKCEDYLCGITEIKDNAVSQLIVAHLSNSALLKATALIKIKPSVKEILQSEEARLLMEHPSLFREITLMYETQ